MSLINQLLYLWGKLDGVMSLICSMVECLFQCKLTRGLSTLECHGYALLVFDAD
jgi:hypothetical protein